MSTPTPSTSERIVEASLKLFNEHGFQNVPALRIAMHLGISPGHLAYHFKSKNDIVMAVLPQLERMLRESKRPDEPFLPHNAALQQIEVYRTLWKYRFFFNALTQLLPQDAELRERYRVLQDAAIAALQDLFDELIAQGFMRPAVAPNSTRMLANSCWMMWLSWLRFEQIENPSREIPHPQALYDAVMLNFSIIQPYFSDEFWAQELDALKKLLFEEAAAAGPRKRKTARPVGAKSGAAASPRRRQREG